MRQKTKGGRLRQFGVVTKKQLYRPYGSFILGAFLGFVFFALAYDLRLVDPGFTDWLLVGEDLKQHFLGWEFYRYEPWTFPIGAISQLAHPFGIAVSYMDSIPLLAIPFKLFAPWLPDNFQYFGLWGLVSYMLQGGIAALIVRRWTKNPLIILLVAAVFVVSPIMMARMFVHTALAGHWIILLAIWAMIEREKIASVKKQIAVWSGLFVVAVLVHPYFVPMVALPFIVSLILLHKKWLATILKAIVPPIVAIAVLWAIGGFMVKNSSGGGLGNYQLNFTSLFNPLDWSAVVPSLHKFTGESLNYLGLGIILLLPVVLYIAAKRYDTITKIKALTKKITLRHVLVGLAFVAITIAAMSPRIFFGPYLLVDVDLPGKIEALWGIFQASARLFWVVYYLIILGVLVCIVKAFGAHRKSQLILVSFLLLFVSIQVADIQTSPRAHGHQKMTASWSSAGFVYNPPLNISKWGEAAAGKSHLVYLDAITPQEFFALADVATRYRLSMNTGYFARAPHENIQAYQSSAREALLAGDGGMSANLYITKDVSFVERIQKLENAHVWEIEGYYIIDEKINEKD